MQNIIGLLNPLRVLALIHSIRKDVYIKNLLSHLEVGFILSHGRLPRAGSSEIERRMKAV